MKPLFPIAAAVVFASTAAAGHITPKRSAATAPPRLAAEAFPLPVPAGLAPVILEASSRYGVDPNLLAAMAFRESRFDSRAVSRRGAQGIMQLMPRTARALGVVDPFDPRQNVLGGAKYVRYLIDRFGGDIDRVLAGYNAGPELVARVGPNATQEAIEYVAAVKAYYRNALRAM